MNREQLYLLVCALGLVPIALGYGIAPQVTMPFMLGSDVSDVGHVHVLRGVMGLYLGMCVLWLLGAFKPRYTESALIGLTVFMFGIAAGRAFAFTLDGVPHGLLVVYLVVEVIAGLMGIALLRRISR